MFVAYKEVLRLQQTSTTTETLAVVLYSYKPLVHSILKLLHQANISNIHLLLPLL
jgi:hypothetical protein